MFEPTPRPPPVKGGRDRARRRVRGTRPHLSSPIAKQWREGDRREAAVEGAFFTRADGGSASEPTRGGAEVQVFARVELRLELVGVRRIERPPALLVQPFQH